MTTVRNKLLNLIFIATIPLVVANVTSVLLIGNQLWKAALADMETISTLVHESIDTTLRESIVSYLKAKVETAIAVVDNEARDSAGEPEDAIVERTVGRLMDVRVADSGYVYVIDTAGRVIIHPDPNIRGSILPDLEPVRTQLEMREGYLEYVWQNTYEPAPLPKALYMETHEGLGWIVAATSYRSEFVQLVDQYRIANQLASVSFNGEAYTVVVDRGGTFVAHPDYPGRRMREFLDERETERIRTALFAGESGKVEYSWPVRAGERRRPKMMYYQYLRDFDWAVATTVYLDSLRRPIIFTVVGFGLFGLMLLLLVVRRALQMSHSVTDPVVRLAEAAAAEKPFELGEMARRAPVELATLVKQFNSFVARIEEQRRQVATREESLQKVVREKTVLIQEIHHRVKNNLQVIASLLSLQSESVLDPRDATLFQRSAERVISMALVHEQLHQTDEYVMVPFDEYIPELVSRIWEANTNGRIDINVDCEPVVLEIYRAVPCGLIVNELITNALEHAFPGDAGGTICVSLRIDGECCILQVADNGVGISPESSHSLGMTLVDSLSQQLGATLTITTEGGTAVTVRIPYPDTADRDSREL